MRERGAGHEAVEIRELLLATLPGEERETVSAHLLSVTHESPLRKDALALSSQNWHYFACNILIFKGVGYDWPFSSGVICIARQYGPAYRGKVTRRQSKE